MLRPRWIILSLHFALSGVWLLLIPLLIVLRLSLRLLRFLSHLIDYIDSLIVPCINSLVSIFRYVLDPLILNKYLQARQSTARPR